MRALKFSSDAEQKKETSTDDDMHTSWTHFRNLSNECRQDEKGGMKANNCFVTLQEIDWRRWRVATQLRNPFLFQKLCRGIYLTVLSSWFNHLAASTTRWYVDWSTLHCGDFLPSQVDKLRCPNFELCRRSENKLTKLSNPHFGGDHRRRRQRDFHLRFAKNLNNLQ